MSSTCYVTGAGGMVGSHLCDYLIDNQEKVNVVGSYFKPTTDISEISDKVNLIECDVRYLQGVLRIVSEFRPDKIFHLAAQSYPPVSWMRPEETFATNVTGTINVFEAIKEVKRHYPQYAPSVVVACSSAQYGQTMIESDGIVDEQAAMLPLNPYGVSKVAQDLLAYQYFRSDGINTIRARIFNSTGPRKVGDVLSDFTKRAVLAHRQSVNDITVGNLETERAILDVRDLVQALYMLSEKGVEGDAYNICGSTTYRISGLLEIIESVIGFKLKPVVDESLLRPTDEKIIFGDTRKLVSATDWKQSIPLEVTVKDMIDYWERRL
jgi:nucleoside-diphosphate-sugar epimerase